MFTFIFDRPVKHGRLVMAQSAGITLTTHPKCSRLQHLDVASTFAHDRREFLRDQYRSFGHICSEILKKGIPGIQGNTINVSTLCV